MAFFPVFLRTNGYQALVVGAGEVALRKIRLLHQFGFAVVVVAPDVHAEISQLLADSQHVIAQRPVAESDLDNPHLQLVIAATADLQVNEQVSQWAKAKHLLVNVVDQPHLCTYITPAIVDRSPLVIAISSGGESPVLARRLRAKIEAFIPAAYGRLAQLFSDFRQVVKQQIPNMQQRRLFWDDVIDGPISEAMINGQDAQAQQALQHLLDSVQADGKSQTQGEVYLVGAGPGDPDLLTFRALRLMQRADVVLYDRLVPSVLLDLCRRDADRIYVGKARNLHSVPQEKINETLVSLALEGKKVCRLKGGDPFIFGRGGEEIQELMTAQVPFQVVPAVTAASGCSAYAGIPLTHRDYAQSVSFVTGHLSATTQATDWSKYVIAQHTLVIYMGKPGIEATCLGLINAGMSPEMPAAMISKGTQPEQIVIQAPIKDFAEKVRHADLPTPTLVIIGEVVKLREHLAWYKPQHMHNTIGD